MELEAAAALQYLQGGGSPGKRGGPAVRRKHDLVHPVKGLLDAPAERARRMVDRFTNEALRPRGQHEDRSPEHHSHFSPQNRANRADRPDLERMGVPAEAHFYGSPSSHHASPPVRGARGRWDEAGGGAGRDGGAGGGGGVYVQSAVGAGRGGGGTSERGQQAATPIHLRPRNGLDDMRGMGGGGKEL